MFRIESIFICQVLGLHNICRNHYPKNLKFTFGQNRPLNHQPHILEVILQANRGLQDEDFPNVFTGLGVASSRKDSDLLKLVKTLALEIAEKTLTINDWNIKQEAKNLVSIIGQKAAEMHLDNSLVSNEIEEFKVK